MRSALLPLALAGNLTKVEVAISLRFDGKGGRELGQETPDAHKELLNVTMDGEHVFVSARPPDSTQPPQ